MKRAKAPMSVSFTPSDRLTESFFELVDPNCVVHIEDVREDAAEALVTLRIVRHGRTH